MYTAIYYDRKNGRVHLWDDTKGYANVKHKRYAYRQKPGGRYRSIYGQELEKIEKFGYRDPTLFESDVPVETRFLIDAYSDSDEVSTNHRLTILDLEVDSTKGYPNLQAPKQKITAIALYDSSTDHYYCFVLDEDGLVKNEVNGNTTVLAYLHEEDLLRAFMNKWREISPTIASGWNCIPTNSKVYTKSSIKQIDALSVGTELVCGERVEQVYPTTKKEVVEIKLANGHVIKSSKDHVFPIVVTGRERYTTLTCKKNLAFLDAEVKNIVNKSQVAFMRLPIHKNENVDYFVSDEEVYLAGLIYTDGSLKNRRRTRGGYTLYQSNVELLQSIASLDSAISGNRVKGYSRYVNSEKLQTMHDFIYNPLGEKCLNVELLSKLSTRQFYLFLSGILDGDGCNSNGVSSCDYTSSGIDNLYSLCFWNGLFVTKRKNTLRYIDFDRNLLKLRHPSRWNRGVTAKFTVRNSKQKAKSILFKKVGGEWLVRINSIKSTGEQVEMLDIKTTSSYFIYDGVKTHNCDGFDFPYLYARMCAVLGEDFASGLSPINICYFNKYKNKMTIAGINCLDYLLLYKKYSGKSLPNYRLDTVAKEELKVGKVEYSGSLDDLKKNDIKKFIEYNLHDVILVKRMDDLLQFIELARTICHVCHVGYEEFNIPSKFLEGALLTYLRRKNLVAPNKKIETEEERAFNDDDDDDDDDDVGFVGAYVKDPVPGRYEWVCSADINSLYPSVIMSLNISPETKLGVIPDWDSEKFVKKTDDKIKFFDDEYTYAEFSKAVVEANLAISANGVVYDQNKIGCIPDILKKWFGERVEFKNKMKECDDKKDKPGYVFWKRRQQVQKILLNSLYGVLGLSIFRFYDLDNAAAVTMTGQEIIKTSAKYVNSTFNKRCGTKDKDYVIYIDTDSLYLDVKSLAIHEKIGDIKPFAIKTIDEVSSELNKLYTVMMPRMFNSTDNRIVIAADVVASAAFWIVKKRYAMRKVYSMELKKDIDDVEIKGLDVVRSSYPKKFRDFMSSVLSDILRGTTNKELNKKVVDFKKTMVDFKLEDVAKNTSVRFIGKTEVQTNFDPVNRDPFCFVPGSTAQCKAALAYNDMLKKYNLTETAPIMHGGKIKWVYLRTNPFGLDGLAFKDDDKDPKIIMDFITTYIDRAAIWNAELEKKLVAFYEALSWEIYSEEQEAIDTFFVFES